MTGDGVDDIALGTDQAGPHAQVFRGGDFLKLVDLSRAECELPGPNLRRPGRHDKRRQGRPGRLRALPAVHAFAGYNADSLAPALAPQGIFNAFTLGGGYVNGLFLAVGDVNGDGSPTWCSGRVSSETSRSIRAAIWCRATLGRNSRGSPRRAGSRRAPCEWPERYRWRWAARHLTSVGEMVTAYKGGTGLPLTGPPPLLFSFDSDPLLNCMSGLGNSAANAIGMKPGCACEHGDSTELPHNPGVLSRSLNNSLIDQ